MPVIGTSPVFLTTTVQVPAPAGVAMSLTWSISAVGLLPAMLAKLKKTPETTTAAATVIAISRITASNGLKPADVFLLISTTSFHFIVFIVSGIQPAQTIATVIRAKPHNNMQPNKEDGKHYDGRYDCADGLYTNPFTICHLKTTLKVTILLWSVRAMTTYSPGDIVAPRLTTSVCRG
jgi:hypothetical protein